jgi:hypothetical protein
MAHAIGHQTFSEPFMTVVGHGPLNYLDRQKLNPRVLSRKGTGPRPCTAAGADAQDFVVPPPMPV